MIEYTDDQNVIVTQTEPRVLVSMAAVVLNDAQQRFPVLAQIRTSRIVSVTKDESTQPVSYTVVTNTGTVYLAVHAMDVTSVSTAANQIN